MTVFTFLSSIDVAYCKLSNINLIEKRQFLISFNFKLRQYILANTLFSNFVLCAFCETVAKNVRNILWGSYNIQCAENLTFPLNCNNPSMGNVTAFVRRQYVNKPTQSGMLVVLEIAPFA